MDNIYTLGIDIGSTASKCVMLRDGKEIVSKSLISVGAGTSGPQRAIANAMYTGRLAKDQKAGKDLQPTIDKMNALINDYNEKSKPFYCAKAGLVDEIVDMPMMRNYIVAFTDSCYQNPESICPFHQMLLPRTIRDFETFKK